MAGPAQLRPFVDGIRHAVALEGKAAHHPSQILAQTTLDGEEAVIQTGKSLDHLFSNKYTGPSLLSQASSPKLVADLVVSRLTGGWPLKFRKVETFLVGFSPLFHDCTEGFPFSVTATFFKF